VIWNFDSLADFHDCSGIRNPEPQILKPGDVSFSYDIKFIEASNNEAFGSRWDPYKQAGSESTHWWSILSSLVIIIALTKVICSITRNIRNDVREANVKLRIFEEIQEEEKGWRSLSRDVFRPPSKTLLFSSLIGTGVQIGKSFLWTLVYICLGFLEYRERGSLATTTIFFFTFMAAFAGYSSARIYKIFKGSEWIKCSLVTVSLYPSITFIIFCGIHLLLFFEGTRNTVKTFIHLNLIKSWYRFLV